MAWITIGWFEDYTTTSIDSVNTTGYEKGEKSHDIQVFAGMQLDHVNLVPDHHNLETIDLVLQRILFFFEKMIVGHDCHTNSITIGTQLQLLRIHYNV